MTTLHALDHEVRRLHARAQAVATCYQRRLVALYGPEARSPHDLSDEGLCKLADAAMDAADEYHAMAAHVAALKVKGGAA